MKNKLTFLNLKINGKRKIIFFKKINDFETKIQQANFYKKRKVEQAFLDKLSTFNY